MSSLTPRNAPQPNKRRPSIGGITRVRRCSASPCCTYLRQSQKKRRSGAAAHRNGPRCHASTIPLTEGEEQEPHWTAAHVCAYVCSVLRCLWLINVQDKWCCSLQDESKSLEGPVGIKGKVNGMKEEVFFNDRPMFSDWIQVDPFAF